jgi:hypothetical protein
MAGLTSFQPSAKQMQIIRAQQARNATFGEYNYMPNVAAITMQDVARRTLVPTRNLCFNLAGIAGGTDLIPFIDAALIPGLVTQVWTNTVAADREQLYGSSLVGAQVSVSCSITQDAGANTTNNTGLASEQLEQYLYQRYTLSVYPTSGIRSPQIFDTELRAFSPVHRLSGADGYTMFHSAVPWGDEFSHVDIQAAQAPVTGAFSWVLGGNAASNTYDVNGVISVSLKTVRGA